MGILGLIIDAIIKRSPEELIGALLLSMAVSVISASVYAHCRRKSSPSPSFVCGLALAVGASCMAVAAGYVEYVDADHTFGRAANHTELARPRPGGPGQAALPPPWSMPGAGWSPGIHVVMAADEDGDGRLNAGEVARLVLRADADGDGLVNFRDIDRLIASRFHSRTWPDGLTPGAPAARSELHKTPEQGHRAGPSDADDRSRNIDE
jgi:hypothetical protein